MKRITELYSFALALALLLLAAAGATEAQTGNPAGETRTLVTTDGTSGIAPVIPAMFEPVVTGGLFDAPLVRSKPLAAVFESVNTQTLPGGTSTVRRVVTRFYRDSSGRTRREQIFYPAGATPSPSDVARAVTIYDPVSGWGYSLNTAAHTASRYKLPTTPATTAPFGTQLPSIIKILRGESSQPNSTTTYTLPTPTVQSLGTQTIAGIAASGWKAILRIPIGALGNTSQIETTYEAWVASDLQMLVKCSVSNPASGQFTFQMNSGSRTEPARSLFEVPAGYATSEMGVVMTNVAPPH